MLPDLDSLALFVQAAETGMRRAAEANHITVPAASRRLALLEHQFKTTLFERHSRGLRLTPAGGHLLDLARGVIADVHHRHAEMANYASGRHAVLRSWFRAKEKWAAESFAPAPALDAQGSTIRPEFGADAGLAADDELAA